MCLSVFGVGIMAAGKASVSRRGDISYLSKRGLEHCADAYGAQADQGGGLDYGSERCYTYGGEIFKNKVRLLPMYFKFSHVYQCSKLHINVINESFKHCFCHINKWTHHCHQ